MSRKRRANSTYLRPLLEEDSPTLFRWINDPKIATLSSNYVPVQETDHLRWFSSLGQRNDLYAFAIRIDGSKRLLGFCQLINISSIHRSAELRIRIGEIKDRGRGYGTAAVGELVEFGFTHLNLNRIYLTVFEDNEQAISAYRRVGFTKEGVQREANLVDGKFRNVVMMSLLARDWTSNG